MSCSALLPVAQPLVRNPFNSSTIQSVKSRTRRQPLAQAARCSADLQGAHVEAELRVAQVRVEVTRRIKNLGRQGKPKEALSELAEMARLGVQPDTQAATALLDACARNHKMDMARKVFDELFDEFLEPDNITFSIMVRGYGECDPPQWAAITSLLEMMDRKYSIKPNTAIYNALLEVCARTKDEERGYEIIERMHAAGCQPDDFTAASVGNRRALRSALRRRYQE